MTSVKMYKVGYYKQQYLESAFVYHRPNDGQTAKYEMLRTGFRDLALRIMSLVPDSDEQKQSLHRLEEAMMWANAGIARNEGKEEEGEA